MSYETARDLLERSNKFGRAAADDIVLARVATSGYWTGMEEALLMKWLQPAEIAELAGMVRDDVGRDVFFRRLLELQAEAFSAEEAARRLS